MKNLIAIALFFVCMNSLAGMNPEPANGGGSAVPGGNMRPPDPISDCLHNVYIPVYQACMKDPETTQPECQSRAKDARIDCLEDYLTGQIP